MALRKSPAFQFYAADYLADEQVQLMTIEEEGVYIRLLAYCWREGSIPADLKALSRLCKGASEEVINGVLGCFDEHPNCEGRLMHRRLEIEREKQEQWSRKQARAGKASGKARRAKKLHAEPVFNKCSTSVEPNANQTRTKTNSSFSSSSSSSEIESSGSSSSSSDSESSGKETSGAEAKQVRSAPAGTLPTNTGDQFVITVDQVQQWTATYPAVDVRQQLREMKAWSDANPRLRKTRKGMLRFVNQWLAKEQDRGGGTYGNAGKFESKYDKIDRELGLSAPAP